VIVSWAATEFARSPIRDPLTEMGGEGIEVEVETIAGKDRQTAWSQDERDRLEHGIRPLQAAWADLEGGDELRGWIKDGPHPQVVSLVAKSGPRATHPIGHGRGIGGGSSVRGPVQRAARHAYATGEWSPRSRERAEQYPQESNPSGWPTRLARPERQACTGDTEPRRAGWKSVDHTLDSTATVECHPHLVCHPRQRRGR